MTKKYFSTNEFFLESGEPYSGYVQIIENIPFTFPQNKKLVVGDNYISSVTLSNLHFDRLLGNDLELPKTKEDCTFGANDFFKSSVLNNIIKNIEANNSYIFKNCLISKNDLPLAEKIPVLSPFRPYKEVGGVINRIDYGPVENWFWSNISSGNIQNIYDKADWPNSVIGHDWFTDNLIDSIIIPTNKPVSEDNSSILYAVFLIYTNKVQLINIYLPEDDIISLGTDPLKIIPEQDLPTEYAKRKFVDLSPANNGKNNLDIITFNNIDPNNTQSAKFKNISGASYSNGVLFVLDSGLNGVFSYDITRCIADRGAANNKIYLKNQLQGKGQLADPLLFDNPKAISALDNTLAILDKNNICVKVFDLDFNYKFTIKSGAFVRQNVTSVKICPFDSENFTAGSIWILSEVNDSLSLDIYDKDGFYLGNNLIKYIQLVKDYWYDPNTSLPSSPDDPVYSKEVIKKIEFSYNNSNYYYIITDRRIIKFQLSQLIEPIGIVSYYYRSLTVDNLIWENTYQPWQAVQDIGNKLITWEYERSKEILKYPQNKCYSITGIPEINADIIFNVLDNKIIYNTGTIQRVDNYLSNKLLYIDNLTKEVTYSSEDASKQPNQKVYAKIGTEVDEYINMGEIPVKTENTFIVLPIIETNDRANNAILFYKEPNIFKSTLLNTEIKAYSSAEILLNNNEEYVDALTFNKILQKLYFNLMEIKKYIFGTFAAGYSVDNLMTYDHIQPDSSIQNLGIDSENFLIGDNEQMSAIANRCFLNIWNVQLNILDKIQTIYLSTLNYNLNAYRII